MKDDLRVSRQRYSMIAPGSTPGIAKDRDLSSSLRARATVFPFSCRAASARAESWLHPAHSVCACFYFWLQPYTPLFRVEPSVHITNIYVHGQIIYLQRRRSQSHSRWRSPKNVGSAHSLTMGCLKRKPAESVFVQGIFMTCTRQNLEVNIGLPGDQFG